MNNAFFLDLPPYMGFHPMFNMDKIKLYEPPFLDEIVDAPRYLDVVILDLASPLDKKRIFEHQMKKTRNYSLDSFFIERKGQYSHHAKWVSLAKLRKVFLRLMDREMGSIDSLRGRN